MQKRWMSNLGVVAEKAVFGKVVIKKNSAIKSCHDQAVQGHGS